MSILVKRAHFIWIAGIVLVLAIGWSSIHFIDPAFSVVSTDDDGTRTNASKHHWQARSLELRMGVEQLRNPYWYERHGQAEEARQFWDKQYWEQALKQWADDGYNAILYWVEPWTETAWQAFLIRHKEFPEARELTPEQADKVIEHVNWIFHKAHELGLKNFLFTYHLSLPCLSQKLMEWTRNCLSRRRSISGTT